MMRDINWPYPSDGENSTEDPHQLSQKFATIMANIRPDGIVRGGMEEVNVPEIPDITWTFLYDSTVNPVILMKSGTDLVAFRDNYLWTIAERVFDPMDKVSAERIGDDVVIVTDNPANGNRLLSVDNGQFSLSPASILRAGAEAITITQDVNGVFPAQVNIGAIDESYHTYAFTWIRKPEGDTAGFVECDIESEDDMGIRQIAYSAGNATGVEIRFANIPTGATHVRLYRTIGTKASIPNWEIIEAGSELLWLTDLNIGLAVPATASEEFPTAGLSIKYLDTATDGAMAGETNKLWTTGKNPIPQGRHVKYHNNRLWVGGVDGYNPGRWYYSEPIRSANPLKWLLMFDYAANYVDTSVDDTENSMGAAASRGDLIFFMDKNVWRLPAGDPENYAPVKIGSGLGTLYPNSICEYNQLAYYLSVRGPAVVGGPEVNLAKEFAVSDLWPNSFKGIGELFKTGKYNNRASREKITGFWYDDNWVISDGETTGCLYAPSGNVMGAWRITSDVKIVRYQPVGINTIYGWTLTGKMYRLFSGTLDGLTPFAVDIQMIPKNIDNANHMGEPYFAAINARWMDSGELRTVIKMDNTRVHGSYRYDEVRPDTPLYGKVMPSIVPKWESQRMVVQQCFREGGIGTWIQPQIQKKIYSRFEYRGITTRVRVSDGRLPEYVSVSEESELSPLDAGIAVFDFQGN